MTTRTNSKRAMLAAIAEAQRVAPQGADLDISFWTACRCPLCGRGGGIRHSRIRTHGRSQTHYPCTACTARTGITMESRLLEERRTEIYAKAPKRRLRT